MKINQRVLREFATANYDRLCWVGAPAAAREFGGQVFCWYQAENPEALVGKSAGGHNICVVADRYIVDGWGAFVEGILCGNPVVDMKRVGKRWVREYYGPRDKWELCTLMSAEEVWAERAAKYRLIGKPCPPLTLSGATQ